MNRLVGWINARASALSATADLESSVGRALARRSAITKTALASIFAKGISVAVTMISVPLTLDYLGTERFGMWMVLSSFTLLLSFIDLGVGNSTLNAVATGSASQDVIELRRSISSAYVVTLVVAAILVLLLAATYGIVPWPKIYNVTSPTAAAEAGPASAVFLLILAITTPLNLIYRIQLGLQQGFRSNLWQSLGSIASLVAIYLATENEASLAWLVVALTGTPALVALVNATHFFSSKRPDLRPSLLQVNPAAIRVLLGSGLLFLVLQACAALMFQSNAIVIAQLMGTEAVSTFSVAERLFGLVSFALGLLLLPLWPAYGEALASQDTDWIKKTFRKSIIFSATSAALLSALLVVAGPTIVSWWVGDSIVVPFTVFLGLGLWKVLESIGNAVAMLLNGLNVIGLQAALAVLNTIANLGLKVWMIDRFGLPGVMFATIIAYSIFSLPWLALAVRQAMGSHYK